VIPELLVELDQAGCDEAVLTAGVFVRALVIEPGFFAAWHLVDTELRRITTGVFLDAIAAKEGLSSDEAQRTADELTELGTERDLRPRFAHSALLSWQAIFNVDFERWGFVSHSRPISLDLVAVYLAEVGQDVVSHRADCEGNVQAIPILMRHTDDGYRVAGVGLDQSLV